MNLIASLLLVTALSIPTPTLVLKSGKRIAVDGPVQIESSRVLFRSGGSFYSAATDDVDLEATRAAGSSVTVTAPDATSKLKVSSEERQRLLKNLEQNHSGTAAPKEQTALPDSPRRPDSDAQKGDEWQWKNAARAHEEEVRRAKEQLELLQRRREELRSQISGLLSQGYKPGQFSYQTTVLAGVEEQIPQAELEVQRAERAYRQFLDDARRQGVMPGWLR